MDPVAALTRFERYLLRTVSERGRAPFIIVVTALSCWLSLCITTLMMIFTDADTESFAIGLIIATAVPLLVAPAAAGCIARLLQALAAASGELHHLAHTDPLTGVLNRRAFVATGEALMAEPGTRHLVAMIDVDEFKAVNDRHGHGTGDRALVVLAERLLDAVSGAGVVGRIGGDEFAVLAQIDDDHSPLLRSFTDGIALDDVVAGLCASVGTAVVAGGTLEDALVVADRSLYEIKRSTRRVASADVWETAG